jgi:hypothetical protein
LTEKKLSVRIHRTDRRREITIFYSHLVQEVFYHIQLYHK